MFTIWKFPLSGEMNSLDIPKGAQPLFVKFQGDDLFLWAKVDHTAETEKRTFFVVGTGDDVVTTGNFEYIGSDQYFDNQIWNKYLVFHVFEWK